LRAKVWNLRFVANKLALLLVLRRQVQKGNEENNETNRAVTRDQSVR
jgi:hypothetical protein